MKQIITSWMSKFYKLVLVITLFSTLQSFAVQTNNSSTEKSYWQSYAPQFIQNTASGTSAYMANWIPGPVQAWINSLSAGQKLAIATTALTGLSSFLNADQIMQLVKDFLAPKAYAETDTKPGQEANKSAALKPEQKKKQESYAWKLPDDEETQKIVNSMTDENIQKIINFMKIQESFRSTIQDRIRFAESIEKGTIIADKNNEVQNQIVLHRLAQEYANQYPELLPYK